MACDFPITIKNPAAKIDLSAAAYIPVPCGTCPRCLDNRINGWVFRLLQHEKVSESALFVTLTYGTNDDPQGHITPNGHRTLVPSDYQKFMKILRNSYRYRKINPETGRFKYYYDQVPKIKYFACGEYGSRRKRPHFHAIIFNTDADRVQNAWSHGNVHIGDVTGASIAYTCKYMNKPKTVFADGDDRHPEMQLVSQGLGANYLTPAIISYHQADLTRLYCTALGGQKMPMPRYYRLRIYSDAQRKQQARNAQKMQMDKLQERQIAHIMQYGNLSTYYRDESERKLAYLEIWRQRSKLRNLIF